MIPPSRTSKPTTILPPTVLVLVAVAAMLVLRVLHMTALEGEAILFSHPTVDALTYFEEARSRAAGTFEYRTPGNAPLYPFLLGLVCRITGADPFWTHLLSSVTGPLCALLIYFAGRRLLGTWPAALGAVLFALYRPGLLYECDYYAAGLANLLVTSSVLLIAGLPATIRAPMARVGLLGLCLGLATVTRTNLLLLTPLAVGVLAWRRQGWRRGTALVLIALAPPALVTVANHRANGEWTFVQARTGHNLYMANNPESDGTVHIRPGPEYEAFRRRPMVEAGAFGPGTESAFYREKFFAFVREEPGAFVSLLARKIWNSLSPIEVASSYDNESHSLHSSVLRMPLPGFGFLLPLVLVGLVRTRARAAPAHPSASAYRVVVLTVAVVWATQILGFPGGRYRYQVAGPICILAGAGVCALWQARRGAPGLLRLLGLLAAGTAITWTAPRFPDHRLPWRAEYHALESFAFLQAGRPDAARKTALLARELRADYAWPHFTLGTLAMGGDDGRGKGADLDAAQRHLDVALRLQPEFPEALQNRAMIALQRGDRRAALVDLQQAIEWGPLRPQPWILLAALYRAAGDPERARQCERRAEEIRQRTRAWPG